MNLKNGYKVMYEVIEDTERVFLASTTGIFADAEEIARFTIGEYKIVYQRGNEFFGVNAEGVETRLSAFDKVFVESTDTEGTTETPSDSTDESNGEESVTEGGDTSMDEDEPEELEEDITNNENPSDKEDPEIEE